MMKLFYSYSHKDERFLNEIAKFMAPLRDSVHLDEWHDRRIQAVPRSMVQSTEISRTPISYYYC